MDAWFKWQPGFLNGMPDYLSGTLEGPPPVVQGWINFWIHTVHVDPTFFAYLVAVGETAIALGLIVGVFSNLTNVAGLLLSIAIWTTAEGFGGPYTPGTVDIGAAIIYVLVFAALILTNAGLYYGLDRRLTPPSKRGASWLPAHCVLPRGRRYTRPSRSSPSQGAMSNIADSAQLSTIQ